MTEFGDALVAIFLALVLNMFIVAKIRRNLPGEEGQFLAKLYRLTLLLRWALAVFLNVYSQQSSFADAFWGDSAQYDWGGLSLAQYWSGDILYSHYAASWVSGYGFVYFVGALYYLFGRNQLLVQFVNATIGSLTMVVIYAIGKHLFGERPARWAARFMAFFPQMVFWSGAMYKDPAIMFCIALCMYAVLKLARRFTPSFLVLFIGSSLALMSLRFYVFYMIAFATLGTFLFGQRRGFFANIASNILLIGVFLWAFSFAASSEQIEQQTSYFDLERLQRTRLDQAQTSQSGFAAGADVSTPEGALTVLPIGLVYLLFAPFPWAITGLRQALTVPETLVWYGLMPAFFTGLAYGMRQKLRECLPILVFTATLTGAYAVFQGNVGTAYRQRTQISMFFFVFMGVGLSRRQEAREARAQLGAAMHPALHR